MSTARTGLSIGVIVALAVAIWAAVSSGNDEVPPATSTSSTVSGPTSSTSSTTTTAPTTTSAATSVPGTTDPEARLEEVRLIVRDLWFGWLSALYSENRDALTQFVATASLMEDFDAAVGTLPFRRAPQLEDLKVSVDEILSDTQDCLVVYRTIDVGDLLEGESISRGVDVLWPHEESWRLATGWTNPSDLWQTDCEGVREELP